MIKKLYVILFTGKPYRVSSFADVYKGETGTPADLPEAKPMILRFQQGETIIYESEPECLNGDVQYRYLSGEMRYLPSGIFREADRFVYSIPKASVLGPLGLVYDLKQRTFIAESAKEWTINLKRSAYTNLVNYPAKAYLKGITVSCLANGADGGFYHFLLDAMIKLQLYGDMLDKADHILFNGPVTDWKLKWLIRAKVDLAKIKWIDNNGHYECEQLLFTNRLISDQQISNWCIGALKRLFHAESNSTFHHNSKIVWISRKGRGTRELQWEHDILAKFPEIERADLAALEADETIALFQSATHIIGAHGAGLTNIYLCRPGTKILEIYPEDGTTYQPCYQRISLLCELDYALMYLNFNDANDARYGIQAFADAFGKLK